jgi:hypothetical protein
MVHKAVEVVKKVVKTVVKVVKKAIKTVTKVAKVVTKKVASFAKETAKKALRNTQAALKAAKNWNDNLSKKITAFYHSDTFKSILHVAASLTAGVLAGVVAGALCGPAALICAAAGSAALGGVFGAALNTGVAAATGEQITAEKVGGWALSNMVPSILGGPRAATKTGWLDVAVSATTKLSGGWGINTGFKASFGKLVDPSRWTLSGRDVPFGGFLPRK